MIASHERWAARLAARWLPPDAARFMRPDAQRFMRPDAARYLRPTLERKYSPDQPRVPAGDSDGGQWTSGAQQGVAQSVNTATDQEAREDLAELESLVNEYSIRAQIDEAWAQSIGGEIRENGFWISRDKTAAFTRDLSRDRRRLEV